MGQARSLRCSWKCCWYRKLVLRNTQKIFFDTLIYFSPASTFFLRSGLEKRSRGDSRGKEAALFTQGMEKERRLEVRERDEQEGSSIQHTHIPHNSFLFHGFFAPCPITVQYYYSSKNKRSKEDSFAHIFIESKRKIRTLHCNLALRIISPFRNNLDTISLSPSRSPRQPARFRSETLSKQRGIKPGRLSSLPLLALFCTQTRRKARRQRRRRRRRVSRGN